MLLISIRLKGISSFYSWFWRFPVFFFSFFSEKELSKSCNNWDKRNDSEASRWRIDMETHMWLYKRFQDKKCQDFMSQRSKVFPKFLGCSPHFHKSLDPKRGSQFKAKISWLYIQKPKILFDRSNRFAYNCRLNH